MAAEPTVAEFEHIYRAWDNALHHHKLQEMLALYAPDATLESPLIPHVLQNKPEGICRGQGEIRELLLQVFARKPPLRRYFRRGYMTSGNTLMFEYPREAPDGEQMDFIEVFDIVHGLIQDHRVYWGWRGIKVMSDDQYRQEGV